MAILSVIRWISGDIPDDTVVFNFYTKNDLIMGAVVAVVVTFSREQRRKLLNK